MLYYHVFLSFYVTDTAGSFGGKCALIAEVMYPSYATTNSIFKDVSLLNTPGASES